MGFRDRLARGLDTPLVARLILSVILFNAVLLGLETSDVVINVSGPFIPVIGSFVLVLFVLELATKMFARGARFWRSGWNLFDLVVVAIALVPGAGSFSALRALRLVRVMRVQPAAAGPRRPSDRLATARRAVAAAILLAALVLYAGGLLATRLFGQAFPQAFGNLGRAAASLLQVIAPGGWSAGIVRPVAELYPLAWLFFLPFVLLVPVGAVSLLAGLFLEVRGVRSRDAEILTRLTRIESRSASGGARQDTPDAKP